MSNELRATAEYVIDKMNEYGMLPGAFFDECESVLQAYLAANPADDSEPVTHAKLKQAFDCDEQEIPKTGETMFVVSLPGKERLYSLVSFSDESGWYLCDDEADQGIKWPIECWGDIRRLCAALKVELKETGDGQD